MALLLATAAGHRAGVAATTPHTLFRFVGRVKPPGAAVTLPVSVTRK